MFLQDADAQEKNNKAKRAFLAYSPKMVNKTPAELSQITAIIVSFFVMFASKSCKKPSKFEIMTAL